MPRQMLCQMCANPNRPHSRPAAAMRNAKRFMQIHVAHISAQFGGPHQTNLCIEICAIQINLPAMSVDDVADINDALFINTVGGRIRNHQCRQIGAMQLGLGFKIRNIHIAQRIAGHHDDLHATHRS